MKKALIIVGSVVLFLLLAIIILPILLRGPIEKKVKETVNSSLNAKVDWKSLDISLISNFPNLAVQLDELSVINKAPFDGDTLVYFNRFTLDVDLESVLFTDEIKVNGISIFKPIINAKYNKEGKANWDITIASTDTVAETPVDTTAAPLKVKLNKIEITDGLVTYADESMALTSVIKGLDVKMKGDMYASVTELNFDVTIGGLTVAMDSTTFFSNTKIAVSSILQANLDKMVFTFKQGALTINQLPLTVEGSFGMPAEGYDMDMKISALKSDFKTFLGIVPPAYLKDLASVKTSGEMSLDMFLKGRYVDMEHLMAFGMDLKVSNATLKYPDLPKSVQAININLNVANPGTNLDATTVDLKQFHFEVASNPFDMTAQVKTPMSNAQFNMAAKGTIDLNSVKDVIPMDSMNIAGIINADLSVAGTNQMIEKELYEQIEAKGDVRLKSFAFDSKDLPQGVKIDEAQLKFTPKELQLVTFKSKVGRSDFNLNGNIQNYLAYALKGGVLKGELNQTSTLIDANEFLTGEPTPTTPPAVADTLAVDTAKVEPIEIPRNIDFTLNSSTSKILYDKLEITDCKGQIVIRDGVATMNNLKMSLLDGSVAVNGKFSTQEPKKPQANLNVVANTININKAANSFTIVDTLAPIAKNTNGYVGAKFDLGLTMGEDLSPILSSVNGKGNLQSQKVNLKGAKFQQSLVSMLNDDKYEELDFQDFNFNFTIKDGNVTLEPFKPKVMGKTLTIQGTTSVDQKINYTINIPVSRKELSNVAGLMGMSLSSEGADIPIDFLIGGMMTKPTFKLDTKAYQTQLKKEATDVAKKEATKILNDVAADPSKAEETLKKEGKEIGNKLKDLFKK